MLRVSVSTVKEAIFMAYGGFRGSVGIGKCLRYAASPFVPY